MPALVAGIHDLLDPKTWMPGTRPGMTGRKICHRCIDISLRYSYIGFSSLVKGAFRMPSDLRQRVRCPRAVSQTAPGRLWVPDRPALRPVPAVRGRLETGDNG
jgi:hypothetical protein